MTNKTPDVRRMALDLVYALLAPLEDGSGGAVQQAFFNALEALLGDEPVYDQLVGAVKMPFNELSLAGLHGLEALALSSWGRQYLVDQAGFLELVTDRRTAASREHLAWKVSICKALAEDPSLNLDGPDLLRIKGFVRDGLNPAMDPSAVVESSHS